MEFTIERAELARLMTHAVRAVENRNTIPILSMVRLDAVFRALTVTATDLTICATATGAATITAPGSACVEAKLLADITKKAGASEMHFALADGWLTVKSGRSKFKLATLPADDFPTLGAQEYDAEFELDIGALFNGVEFAIASEEARYYLNGIYLAGLESGLTAVATDGHRLAKSTVDGDSAFVGVIVPRKAVSLIGDGMAAVSVSQNKIRIVSGDTTLVSKLIDGTYPDYERVIPRNNDKTVTVDRDAMMRAADRVVTISAEKGRAVKLSIVPGAIAFSAHSEMGEASDEIEAEYSGEPVEVGFNSQYLRDMFAALPGGPVEIRIADGMSPALVTSPAREGWEAVLMPVRVS